MKKLIALVLVLSFVACEYGDNIHPDVADGGGFVPPTQVTPPSAGVKPYAPSECPEVECPEQDFTACWYDEDCPAEFKCRKLGKAWYPAGICAYKVHPEMGEE